MGVGTSNFRPCVRPIDFRTLLRGDLGKVGCSLFDAPFVEELNPDAVDADLPVQESGGVLKVTEDRDRDVQARKFIPSNRAEARILHCTESDN